MDLREIARLAVVREEQGALLAPYSALNPVLQQAIAQLRAQGEIVVELLPGETLCEGPLCDRKLVERNGQWITESIIKG